MYNIIIIMYEAMNINKYKYYKPILHDLIYVPRFVKTLT